MCSASNNRFRACVMLILVDGNIIEEQLFVVIIHPTDNATEWESTVI